MLSAKQKRFVDEYLIDLNATQAAIRAGYSQQCAKEQGYRMLTYVHIQEEIKKVMDEQTSKLNIDTYYILKRLKDIAENHEATNPSVCIKALELMGKYLGMFSQKVEVGITALKHEDWLKNLMTEGK